MVYFIPVGGPTLKQAARNLRQLEPATKSKGAKSRRSQLSLEFRKRLATETLMEGSSQAKLMNRFILDTIEALNCQTWGAKGECTSKIPAAVCWVLPQMRSPTIVRFLPDRIKEKVLTDEEKKCLFQVSDNSKPWIVFPALMTTTEHTQTVISQVEMNSNHTTAAL